VPAKNKAERAKRDAFELLEGMDIARERRSSIGHRQK
jgi:hypothetical protein